MIAKAKKKATIRGPVADRLYRPLFEKRWGDLPREICFWGGAGTAKSFQVMLTLVLLCMSDEIGGLRIMWTRKTRRSITESSIVTYQKVLHEIGCEMSSKPSPQQRTRETFETAAGTNILVWMSLEDPLNAFSAEYDIIVYEEAIQTSESTYELAGGRCLRNFAIPWQGLISITNPGPKAGWLYRRMFKTRRLTSCRTTIHDNPAYWDIKEGRLTEKGESYYASLSHTYTDPVRRKRLLEGEFCSEEGWIFEGCWDDERHTFEAEWTKAAFTAPRLILTEPHPLLPREIPLRYVFGSMDLGFQAAGVLQIWGIDYSGRMFLIDETYHTQRDRAWWTEVIIDKREKFGIECIVADHAPELHRHWNATIEERFPSYMSPDGMPFIRKCRKSRGDKDALKVDVARESLAAGVDGIPKAFFNRSARRHTPDPVLAAFSKPTCTTEEIPELVWHQLDDTQRDEKLPVERLKDGRANHGFDAWVYACRFLLEKDLSNDWTKDKPELHPGTLEHHLAVMEKRWKQQ